MKYKNKWLSKRKNTEAAVRRCSAKQVLLKISQNLQENNYVGVPFLIKVFKKRLRHKCFLVDFVKLFRNFFIEHLWCF